MLLCIVFGLIFAVSGLLFFTGKALRWVKGWQMMSDEEKAQIRIVPLCQNVGSLLFVAGTILLTGGISDPFRVSAMNLFLLGWFVLAAADVFFISRSKRYTTHSGMAEKK